MGLWFILAQAAGLDMPNLKGLAYTMKIASVLPVFFRGKNEQEKKICLIL